MNLLSQVVISFAVLRMFTANVCLGNGWTKFQGPVAEQVALAPLPLEWSAAKGLIWEAEITGYGQSSPVVWERRIYVTSISGEKKEHCHVMAFDLDLGKPLWTDEFEAATQAENNNYISKAAPTPVVDKDRVICFFEGGDLRAYDHRGEPLWQRNLVTEFGAIESRHGLAASLEQTETSVFVWVERQADPYILAIDKVTGKDLWKKDGLGVTSWSSPRLVPVKDGTHLVLSGVGKIAGLDPATGDRLWTFEGIKGNSTPTPVPVGNGRFLIGATVGRGEGDSGRAAESNGLISIEQGSDGAFQVGYVWKSKRATSSFGSPLAHHGRAYFVNATGVLFCLDLETGEELYSQRLGDSIWATPIASRDRIAFFGKGGAVSIISDGPQFERLAENSMWEAAAAEPGAARSSGGPVLYAAVLVNERLLLRRGDPPYCVAQPLTD